MNSEPCQSGVFPLPCVPVIVPFSPLFIFFFCSFLHHSHHRTNMLSYRPSSNTSPESTSVRSLHIVSPMLPGQTPYTSSHSSSVCLWSGCRASETAPGRVTYDFHVAQSDDAYSFLISLDLQLSFPVSLPDTTLPWLPFCLTSPICPVLHGSSPPPRTP